MKVTIQTPGFIAGKALIDYVQGHVAGLSVTNDRILEAQVVLKLVKSDTGENKVCEVRLVVPGNDLFAQKQHHTFENAVLHCIDALKQQASRWKQLHDPGRYRGAIPGI
ncbi:HPF/RaiA family ribosome-associated protein [Dawidia soli]|uniref:HPF/RaiA family ribosome-associated protein n=1 Tax=Dawidia soli TaxID=2782352 RepID=A0AAP2GHI7_9BACT|nr:HPF/RaiA family ribosome-associated protein [Dawidia soli]MBT1686465.1 HPF/RaiA family ribosome-associated protein [Dawidia soli]